MNNAFLPLAVATILAAFPASAQEAPELPCKNHYILRCGQDEPLVSWKMLPDSSMPHGHGHTATALADGRVLVVGGAHHVLDRGARNLRALAPIGAETYDPATGVWQATGPMDRWRIGHQAIRLLDGRVLVVGGDEHEYPYWPQGTAEIFDPTSGSWTPTGNPVVPRSAFTASLLPGGTVLVAGGYDHAYDTLRSAELYDPATGLWALTGSLVEPRWAHTATPLLDGRVLVVGGLWDTMFMYTLGSAEMFDPATGAWLEAGWIGERNVHTATLAEDGTVVIAGGSIAELPLWGLGFPDSGVASTAIYDPGKGTWSVAGNLDSPRGGHLAVRLRGYGILLVGGADMTMGVRGFRSVPVERSELLSRGANGWRGIPSADALAPHNYYSATELADGTVLFIGDVDGARAALLSPGEGTR